MFENDIILIKSVVYTTDFTYIQVVPDCFMKCSIALYRQIVSIVDDHDHYYNNSVHIITTDHNYIL